jgi:TPP-dependent pyruvate/acetoin dehydrogenase alpha subunit
VNTTCTAADLIAFEEKICEDFAAKLVRAPIHLSSNNEQQLLEIFSKHVEPDDWVCSNWRSHYHCLLKGVPPHVLRAEILAGRSISLCFPKYRIISSAIVGGILPIAVGLAMAIKRRGGKNKVVCFMGEMTAETGIAHECMTYARNFLLPILFVIEDNGKSVCTPTYETWGERVPLLERCDVIWNAITYKYESKFPHAGPGGARIQF